MTKYKDETVDSYVEEGYRDGVDAVIAHLRTLGPQNVTARYVLEIRLAIHRGLI